MQDSPKVAATAKVADMDIGEHRAWKSDPNDDTNDKIQVGVELAEFEPALPSYLSRQPRDESTLHEEPFDPSPSALSDLASGLRMDPEELDRNPIQVIKLLGNDKQKQDKRKDPRVLMRMAQNRRVAQSTPKSTNVTAVAAGNGTTGSTNAPRTALKVALPPSFPRKLNDTTRSNEHERASEQL